MYHKSEIRSAKTFAREETKQYSSDGLNNDIRITILLYKL